MAGKSGIKAGKAFIIIEAVNRTQTVLNRVAKNFQAFGQRLTSMGQGIATKALMALTPVGLGVKVFASFDDSMRKVEARSSGTAQQMEELRFQAKELGRTTSFTASQVGELQAKLAQKGFNRGEIKAMTADVLNLARAAGEGTEEDTIVAANGIAESLRQFDLGADQAQRVADVFTTAVNNSNFSLEGLQDSMSKVGSLSADMGFSLEETVAGLSAMTNVGVSASEAGTAMTSFLARMSKKQFVDDFNTKLKALTGNTVKFTDEAGNMKKPLEILDAIRQATGGLGTAQRGDLLSNLFGVRQFGKATAGARGAADAMKLLTMLQKNAGGQAKKTAAQMDAGIGGSFRKLWSAVEGLGIAIGEALTDDVGNAVGQLIDLVGWITEWINKNKELVVWIVKMIALAGAIGIGLMVLGTVISTIGTIIGGLASVVGLAGSALSMLLSPIGLVVAAIAGIGVVLYKTVDGFRNFVDSITGFITERFTAMGETINNTFGGVVDAMAVGDMEAAWEIAMLGLEQLWDQLIDFLMDGWDNFTKFFVDDWRQAVAEFKKVWVSVQGEITKGLTDLMTQAEQARASLLNEEVDEINARRSKALPGMEKELEAMRERGLAMAQQLVAKGMDADTVRAIQERAGSTKTMSRFGTGEGGLRDFSQRGVNELAKEFGVAADDIREFATLMLKARGQAGVIDAFTNDKLKTSNPLEDAFDNIDKNTEALHESFDRQAKEGNAEDKKRDERIAQRAKRLEQIRQQMAAKRAEQDAASDAAAQDAANATEGAAEDMSNAANSLIEKGGDEVGNSLVATSTPAVLMKGTVEAAQQAYKNAMNARLDAMAGDKTIEEQQLEEAKKHTALLAGQPAVVPAN